MLTGVRTNLSYLIFDALRTIRENPASAIFTAVTLGFSLAILAFFFIIFVNLNMAASGLADRVHMVVYVKDGFASYGPDKIKKDALGVLGVRSAEYVSKEAALKELKDSLKGRESVLDAVDINPLPASVEIKVLDAYMEPMLFGAVVDGVRRLQWAEEVQYSGKWLKKFSAFLKFTEVLAAVIGVFLTAAVVFVVTNTIRLTIYAKKDEIEVMRLVGAGRAFIMLPFVIEGVLHGLAGGVVSIGMLSVGMYAVSANVPAQMSFVIAMPATVPVISAALLSAGLIMGGISSVISLIRFLK
ncbi:ABC transporter permease [bacterium]|nr:MAG: ABC transporter permease [bacterium]